MTVEPHTQKVRMDLTEREMQLLKDLLFEETQVGNFNGSHLARCIYYKLEASQR